jgi:hypothetical protein
MPVLTGAVVGGDALILSGLDALARPEVLADLSPSLCALGMVLFGSIDQVVGSFEVSLLRGGECLGRLRGRRPCPLLQGHLTFMLGQRFLARLWIAGHLLADGGTDPAQAVPADQILQFALGDIPIRMTDEPIKTTCFGHSMPDHRLLDRRHLELDALVALHGLIADSGVYLFSGQLLAQFTEFVVVGPGAVLGLEQSLQLGGVIVQRVGPGGVSDTVIGFGCLPAGGDRSFDALLKVRAGELLVLVLIERRSPFLLRAGHVPATAALPDPGHHRIEALPFLGGHRHHLGYPLEIGQFLERQYRDRILGELPVGHAFPHVHVQGELVRTVARRRLLG